MSSTQTSFLLTAADLAAAGSLTLRAVNPAPGGGNSSNSFIAANNPAPTLTSLSPASLAAGATSPTVITMIGTNFLPSSTVLVGTSGRLATIVSSTQLTFPLTVADQALPGNLSIRVVNSLPGGGTSAAANLTVTPLPTPVLTQVSPLQFFSGSPTGTITITGSSFGSSSIVTWNGTPLATSLYSHSTTSLYATIPSTLLATAGSASIAVSTPQAIPIASNALSVSIVDPPAPALSALSATSGPVNTALILTMTGNYFTTRSAATLNGVALPTTYQSQTSLTVTVPASSVSLPGNYSFGVTTTMPGGGVSASLNFTAYVPFVNNSMVYNPVNGLLYLSVPSSAGAPFGNTIVSMDPETGILGTPIAVGSEPNKLALATDGRYLWVGLDGAGLVRKVDLLAGTAGLQFSVTPLCDVNCQNGATSLALIAVPNSDDSVAVSVGGPSGLVVALFDAGVLRGSALPLNQTFDYYQPGYSLQIDGTRNEIYVGQLYGFTTILYSSTGLTAKAAAANYNTNFIYADAPYDENTVVGGRFYTDYGTVYDAETKTLLGSLYASGTNLANGPVAVDATLGKIFSLDTSSGASSFYAYNRIQVFNTADFSLASDIAISTPNTISSSFPATRLVRWGTNGLAFRTSYGVFSVRSNLVKDVSSLSADLSVTLTASGPGTTGSDTVYTAVITNSGSATATNVSLALSPPSTGVLVSATPAAGTCSPAAPAACNLGTLPSGSSASIRFAGKQLAAGNAVFTAQVNGSETDPNASNNLASATSTITGSTYSVAPVLASLSPAAIVSGSADAILTLAGSGFSANSVVQAGGVTAQTTYVSPTQLTATIPAAALATLGWTPVTVTTPAPEGGVSAALPLSIYSVLTLGANHIVYDPYSRKVIASIGSGTSTIAANSLLPITPETATPGTPIVLSSNPTLLALSSDGQVLYTILKGSNSLQHFNMLTQRPDFSVAFPTGTNPIIPALLGGVATQPGTENTIALDAGYFQGIGLYDVDPVAHTITLRGTPGAIGYETPCFQFFNSGELLVLTGSAGGPIAEYAANGTGLTLTTPRYSVYPLRQFTQCFTVAGGLAFSNDGGVANLATTPVSQAGSYLTLTNSYDDTFQAAVPDVSLGRTFFVGPTSTSDVNGFVSGIVAYDQQTFLPTAAVNLNFPDSSGAQVTEAVDIVRWGQDGLAALTTGGQVYLLRGPVVAPQLLNQNSPPVLSFSSALTASHGAGNTLLTLTGSNFVPGIAALWNGSYRTTTIVDPTHVTVAIAAGDLAAPGTAILTLANPGTNSSATVSSGLTFTIQ